jgi:4-hydroxy-tetrahydrodipicolinate synthase
VKKVFFKPTGVYPAMATPFTASGNIDEAEMRRYVRWLIKQGVHGLFPLGSIGEFIHLETEEKMKILEIVVDEAGGKVPVIPGTTASSTDKCVKLTRTARDMGCQGAVISPPYYYPVSQGIIEAHFETVAKALPDFPIILYNIPLFSTPITYDVVKRLSHLDNVVAIKDSSGSMVDLLHFYDKIRIAGEDLNILVGREEMFLAALSMGSHGTMTASSGIIPEIMLEIYDSFQAGDFSKALRTQFSMLNLVRAMFAAPFPLGFKAALECRGFVFGEPKQMLSDTEEENFLKVKSEIYKIIKQLLGDRLAANI